MANSGRIVGDLKAAAKGMLQTETFPTGAAIMQDAAHEIEALREALVRYGDRAALSKAQPHLRPVIDVAFAINLLAVPAPSTDGGNP